MREPQAVIATTKPWNIQRAREGGYQVITTPKELLAFDDEASVIFFPHWSWIIPPAVWKKYTCVVFHMTDLPYGRGGTPLQNLIKRKRYKTTISALKVNGGLDTGPIYCKWPFDLSHGSARELYIKAADIIFNEMIPYILSHNMKPKTQRGRVTTFQRLKDTKLEGTSVKDVVDQVRMVDAEGYPPAYVDVGNVRIDLNCIDEQTHQGTFTVYANPRSRRASR